MTEKETEFTKKIHNYSKQSIQLISDLATSVEGLRRVVKIVEASETEEEAVRKLKELQSTTLTETEQQK